jgi:hypothetical protein
MSINNNTSIKRRANQTVLESLPASYQNSLTIDDENENPSVAAFRKSHATGFDKYRNSLL